MNTATATHTVLASYADDMGYHRDVFLVSEGALDLCGLDQMRAAWKAFDAQGYYAPYPISTQSVSIEVN